jgi:DNA-binding transcriptional regulator YdaS (Cro superfamily)
MKERIRACGLRQAEIASQLGVSKAVVSQWISGRSRVPAERAVELERVTGIARGEWRPDLWPPADKVVEPDFERVAVS